MAPRNPLRSFLLITGLALGLGCSQLKDPAVRLAQCVERGSEAFEGSSQEHSSQPCRLGTDGGYLVVLHPQGQLSDEELIQGGVPERLVPLLRQIRNGDNEQVLVFPYESAQAASRTTYQHRFARIPQLVVLQKETPDPVVIELRQHQEALEIASLR
ncbi:MAG TPA: hypothetical protein VJ725_00960 [Thermoanaerobaculia bacterium]|nr:hypothetical protein [Thermoanaerobaculia bacterium]